MNGKQIIKDYPKSTEALLAWFKTVQKTGIPELDKAAQELPVATLAFLLSASNPRFLYEFFDSKLICMYLEPAGWLLSDEPALFTAKVDRHAINSGDWAERTKAEDTGFIECFKILEEELS